MNVRFWPVFNQAGMPSSTNPRIWATPIVATVRIRRGAFENRRMMANSTSPLVTTAATIPTSTAGTNGHLNRTCSSSARVAAKAPSSP